MDAQGPGTLLTVDELSEYLQVPAKTIYHGDTRTAGRRGFALGDICDSDHRCRTMACGVGAAEQE